MLSFRYATLLQLLHAISTFCSDTPNSRRSTAAQNAPDVEEYEYIVVGSGAGGGPLAARLALNGRKVLLIEAGDDQGANLNQQVPAFHAFSTEDASMRWDYYVEHYADPERAKTDSKMTWETPSGTLYVGKSPPPGSKMKGILYPRTGTLGGCTAHNAMVNVYPHARDWEHIMRITGDKSWNPSNMRKLYQKMEMVDYVPAGSQGHGFGGWLGVHRAPVEMAAPDATLLTVGLTTAKIISSGVVEEATNVERIMSGDMNSADPGRDVSEGVWQIPLAIKNDSRSGARDAIMNVYNAKTDTGKRKYPLEIALNTFVTRVLFASNTTGGRPRATGVEFIKGKSLYRADPRSGRAAAERINGRVIATRDVILSAGAYNSPQLLKLSGIGPRDELTKLKIAVRVDLPGVGTNLQDHFEIGLTLQANEAFPIIQNCTFNQPGDPCLALWREGKGVYGHTNGFSYGVIKKSSVAQQDEIFGHIPDIFIFGGIADFRGYYPNYSRDVYSNRNWTWVVLKAHTGNTAGTVKLASADPLDPPHITFNYFDTGTIKNGEDQRDLIAMAEAVELARKISRNVSTPTSNGPVFTEVYPGPNTQLNHGLTDYIKSESWSHHASCTCPIGADNDPMAVLDSKFRVRGVDGLRVVDASVFPRIPGFFVAAPTYMMGEKAAEAILAES
jgi:choline dehydrogenase